MAKRKRDSSGIIIWIGAALVIVGTAVVYVLKLMADTRAPTTQPAEIVIEPPEPAPAATQPFTLAMQTRLPAVPNDPSWQAMDVDDPDLASLPLMPGWPKALPGSVVSAATVADIDGDGKPEILVNCGPITSETLVHPHVNPCPLLFAFRADGSIVPGWPIPLTDDPMPNGDGYPWAVSPSVVASGFGHDYVVTKGGHNAWVMLIDPVKGSLFRIWGSDGAASLPIADLDRNGVPDIVASKLAISLDGKPIEGWTPEQRFRSGYAPAIGPALRDGRLQLYFQHYRSKDTGLFSIEATDSASNPIAGWPHGVDDPSPTGLVMGDVTGDFKMEVICSTGHRLHAWNADGTPLPGETEDGPITGIFKEGVSQNTASPALADLDGDGKAEIILFDNATQSIRAWHGDGRGVGNETQPPAAGQPEGLIAKLPTTAHGVSVVSLGDDPKVMDFFAGTYWVRRFADGTTKVTNMLPHDAGIQWMQPTVADVDGDGKADVIFGLSDGRLFVYRTGLAYHADRMQWPTANGNFQHTGCWRRPAAAVGQ